MGEPDPRMRAHGNGAESFTADAGGVSPAPGCAWEQGSLLPRLEERWSARSSDCSMNCSFLGPSVFVGICHPIFMVWVPLRRLVPLDCALRMEPPLGRLWPLFASLTPAYSVLRSCTMWRNPARSSVTSSTAASIPEGLGRSPPFPPRMRGCCQALSYHCPRSTDEKQRLRESVTCPGLFGSSLAERDGNLGCSVL